MGTATSAAERPTDPAPGPASRGVTSPTWAVARRWLALTLFAVVALSALLRGSWQVSFDAFEDGVRSGAVTHVRTDMGDAVTAAEAGAQGKRTVTVQWRRWGVPFSAETEVRLRDAAALEAEWQASVPEGLTFSDDLTPRPDGSLADTVLIPGWAVLTVLLLYVGTVARIIAGAEPIRMTRWAWFWALWVPWIGAVAFWVFGEGARRGEGRQKVPGIPDRRVTGWFWVLLGVGVPMLVALLSTIG
ncbi:hypothetical protein [Nocardioides yefusunii]|uniref:DUF3592 domain-containing protein n=1 Tax=Nocardioides yefusunii TaxID=2500546 RepID=A0ABW1QYK3_9ACTN|nr:hypothetical protein [Nocardioides yefusunii]